MNGTRFVTRMSKPRRNAPFLPLDDSLFAIKRRKPVPYEFVLDAIAPLSPETRPMFGCLAVYVEGKIVLILREKRNVTEDNGVWFATTSGVAEESSSNRRVRVALLRYVLEQPPWLFSESTFPLSSAFCTPRAPH